MVQRHVVLCYMPYQNFGQIDRNSHNHVFDDVKCKPPRRLTDHNKSIIDSQDNSYKNRAKSCAEHADRLLIVLREYSVLEGKFWYVESARRE